jgi:hypothetical protein
VIFSCFFDTILLFWNSYFKRVKDKKASKLTHVKRKAYRHKNLKPGLVMVAQTCNPSPWEAEAGRSWVRKTSLGYTARFCLKRKKKKSKEARKLTVKTRFFHMYLTQEDRILHPEVDKFISQTPKDWIISSTRYLSK